MSRLIIGLLGLEKEKVYGFQEYIFNLLNCFYRHSEGVRYGQIAIWCKDSSQWMFNPGVLKRSPEVLTIHNLLYKCMEWLNNTKMWWQREVVIQVFIGKTDRIVAISQFISEKNTLARYVALVNKIYVRTHLGRAFLWLKCEACCVFLERRGAA